ncbi:hypothetical protein [Hymenobacter cavernae]|uniref:Uncharacterized protein n=1 Tax=Hymenobacter cavernae TaxID=2044852 RepID=A0ABQ1TR64_9BACT|nr:hypothetical protein [Hymenobacter cavernae]GGE99090.1 hypothetical protein GCM10011383_07430 [Hymenobacter cavernae]
MPPAFEEELAGAVVRGLGYFASVNFCPLLSRFSLVALLLASLPVCAQSLPVLDQNPASLRWYQLRTAHFRVLYPTGFEARAQRTAQRLEQVYAPVSATLERPPRPIPLLLQNQTTVNNGFVTILPRHSEFFTTPPQDPFLSGTLDWLDLLSVHELRHVVQYDKGLQGLSKVAYQLFGYGGLGVAGLGLPDWFAEGDAVGTETVLTRSGRGRIPNFDLGFRANLLAGKRFSYPKAVAGSYRDNVPNHYVLGYFLTTNLKCTNGANAWSPVLDRYYNFPAYPFSFSNSLRQTAGLRVEELYQRTLTDLDSLWRAQQRNLHLTEASPLAVQPERGVFTEYQYPQYVTDSTVLAVKTGLGDISQLVLLSRRGKEKRVFVQGLVNNPEMLSVGGGKVCWPEFRYDPRWGQRVFSEIRLLDLGSGHLTHLTHRTRYTAAALSPDGRSLVAVRTDSAYQHRLVLLDAKTGQVRKVLANPTNDFYQQPRWRADLNSVVVVVLKPGGKTLELIDTETEQHQQLLPVANENLSHPQPWGDYVFYNSPRSGIDNVYALDTRSGRQFQVTSRPLGAYHAAVAPGGQQLAFHDFRAEGARVVTMPLEPRQWTPVPAAAPAPVSYAEPLVAQEPGAARVRAGLPDSVAPNLGATRYRRLQHPFNVYSWGLVQAPSGQALTLGVRSQDLLNTTQAVVGAGYDQTERVGNVSANLSYQGLFPVFDVMLQHGGRQTSAPIDRNLPVDSVRTDRWQYTRLTAGARLPLNLTRSRYLEALNLGTYYSEEQVRGYDLPVRYRDEVGFGRSLHVVTYSLSYARQLLQSKRDVAPRWAQSLSASWRTTPFAAGLQASQWAVQGGLYVPGLLKHHAVRLRGGYQRQSRESYQFGAAVFYPRGQGYVSFDRLRTGSIEYRLPVADMHWALGRWLYVQRVKAAGFLDVADGQNLGQPTQHYRTAGLDVTFVFNTLRLRVPFEAGTRTIYNQRLGTWEVQPLVLDIGF